MDPERLELPSASSAYRRRRCPGSVNLVRELRKAAKLLATPDDPYAQSGTAVHNAWCDSSHNGELSSMQRDTLASLLRMEGLLVADWAGNDPYTLLGREVRLWLHQGLEPIHSGQFDVAYGTISTGRMLILDAKTLFGEVSPAQSNDQLRELVALAAFNYPAAKEFTVAILQPWVSSRPSVAVYDQRQAELALAMLRTSIEDANDPDAPRIPGPWCSKCPAIAQCEEAKQQALVTTSLAKRIEKGEYVLPIGPKGAEVLEFLAAAEPLLEALRERYKALLLQEPDAVPGWYMKEGKKVREITDIQAAYALASQYISLEQFLGAASLKVTPLQEAFGLASNPKLTGRNLEQQFNQAFEKVISFKQYRPELTRISERKGRHKELKS